MCKVINCERVLLKKKKKRRSRNEEKKLYIYKKKKVTRTKALKKEINLLRREGLT